MLTISLTINLNYTSPKRKNCRISKKSRMNSVRKKAAKVQINAILPNTKYGAGSYQMTSVKKMDATEEFFGMSSEIRNCEIESYNECRTRHLVAKCGCIPWELRKIQVKLYMAEKFQALHAHLQK